MKLEKLIIPGVIVVIVIAAILFWQLSAPKEKVGLQTSGLPIKMFHSYWPSMYWVKIAEKKGWFKEAGLNIKFFSSYPDYAKSLQDMAEGKIDIHGLSLFDVINLNLKGADLVSVINAGISSGPQAILARQEIASIKDLKGKKIGVSKNTYMDYILNTVLEKNRLTSEEVTFVDLPGEKVVEEFIKGTVDAIVAWEPFLTQAIKKGNARKLFDTSEIPGLISDCTTFQRSFIEERPNDVQAVVNVWDRATTFMKESPKEAFEIIAQSYNVTPGEAQQFAQLDQVMDLRDNLTAFTYAAGYESLYGRARKINNFMIKKGITDQQLDSTEFIDGRFIRALKSR